MKFRFIRSILLLWGAIGGFNCYAEAQQNTDTPTAPTNFAETWVATDALGRTTPLGGVDGVPLPRSNKTVAMFYYIWQGAHGPVGPYDISKALLADPKNPRYGPLQAFHWWGEPEAGYYRADDPWVIRRNLSMLGDAGVDVIFFDVTNAVTYLDTVKALCEIATQMRRQGNPAPQIAFLSNSSAGMVQEKLYDEFYSKNLYPDLWFRWAGKPLIMGDMTAKVGERPMRPEVIDFFSWRKSWAWTDPNGWYGDGKGKWPWLDNTPQKPGLSPQGVVEQMVVETAQHPTSNKGKSFHDGQEPPLDDHKLTPDTNKGLYFAEQWKHALEVDPPLIFVTQWNEWVAQRFEAGANGGPGFLGHATKAGESFFVDVYNAEFNRDIEPMKGGWGDNYYYQLVSGIRRFKGARAVPKASGSHAILLNGDFKVWETVGPEFRDTTGDTLHRDFGGYTKELHFTNDSGRNDIVAAKVARDAKFFYCYARTQQELSPWNGEKWMQLFIDADQKASTGWNGYDFAVNLKVKDAKTTTIARFDGKQWSEIGTASYVARGNQLEIAVPRALVPTNGANFDFHWTDNAAPNDINDWFINGDSAPNRRFNFRYAP